MADEGRYLLICLGEVMNQAENIFIFLSIYVDTEGTVVV